MKQKFEASINQVQAEGNRAREAELRSQYGLWLGQEQNWHAAVAQFAQAAQLAQAAQQMGLTAQYRYAQALALQHMPAQQQAARQQLAQALHHYRLVDQPAALARAQRNLALRRLDEGNMPGAQAALAEGIAALADAHEEEITAVPRLLAELYRDRAILHWMNGEIKPAEKDLETAVYHAQRTSDQSLIDAIRSVRRTLAGDTVVADPLVQSLQQSLAGGTFGQEPHPLQTALAALQQGDAARALDQAETVRKDALNSSDLTRYPRYLSACLLIAVTREQLGDDAGVIAILLTAKGTLERRLGKMVGQQLSYLLDGLHPRWGEARFQAALAAYRRSST